MGGKQKRHSPGHHTSMKLGGGGRFNKLAKKVGSPALAAYIGRKKYGAKKMASMAAKGRKH
jgi:hypothetical protein